MDVAITKGDAIKLSVTAASLSLSVSCQIHVTGSDVTLPCHMIGAADRRRGTNIERSGRGTAWRRGEISEDGKITPASH